METITQTQDRIQAILLAYNPTLDFSPGSVLTELVVNLTAQAHNEVYNQVQSIQAGQTVNAVLASTTDTFSPVMDSLASNYDTFRNQGSFASGSLKITVNKNKPYFIPKGFQFTQPNLLFSYQTITDYSINLTSTPPLLADGNVFYFIIQVQALTIGVDKQVANGTQFAIATGFSLPEFIQAQASGAFTQGQSLENDRELITRFKLGLATKNLVSPYSIQAVLKDHFPNFKSTAITGIGSPEETRGKTNPLNIALPGMVDVYIRMSDALPSQSVALTGTCLGSGQWSIAIPATSVPGFYDVASVTTSGGGIVGSQDFTLAYGYDTTSYANKNSIASAQEARFTRYQTCTVVINNYKTSASAGATETFSLELVYQPNISDVQTLFLDEDNRIPCADYLVKGIVPCNVSVNLVLVKSSSLDTLDTTPIKAEIFNYINSQPIGGTIDASQIVKICHKYNIKRVDLPVKLKGAISIPTSVTGEKLFIEDADSLQIPARADLGITGNTTAFFINYFDENGVETIGIKVI
jgi:hypothetical protein